MVENKIKFRIPDIYEHIINYINTLLSYFTAKLHCQDDNSNEGFCYFFNNPVSPFARIEYVTIIFLIMLLVILFYKYKKNIIKYIKKIKYN